MYLWRVSRGHTNTMVHQPHSAFPLLITTQWPGFKGLRIKCYTILTHIKYFCHILYFFKSFSFVGIAVAWYHKVMMMWKAVRGMSEMLHHAVLTLGFILCSLANRLLWETNTGQRDLTFNSNIRIMVPLSGCCVFLYFRPPTNHNILVKTLSDSNTL